MIYTVTCNPALDCAVQLNGLTVGALNRTAGATLVAGGKGVNVSRVLGALGERKLQTKPISLIVSIFIWAYLLISQEGMVIPL